MKPKIHVRLLPLGKWREIFREIEGVDHLPQDFEDRLMEERISRMVQTLLRAHRADAFSPGFAYRVMHRIRKTQPSEGNLFSVWASTFRPIAIAGGFLILLLLTYNVLHNQGLWMASVFNGNDVAIEEVFSPAYYYIAE